MSANRSSIAPAWLLETECSLCPCGCIGRRTKGSFVDKTIAGGSRVLRQSMFDDEIAQQPGLLQRIDARVKLVTLLAVLVAAAFVHHIAVLAVLYAVLLGVAAASQVGLRWFVKRVWLFVPVFTAVVVLPATLNLVTRGHVVLSLGTWLGHPVGVTSQGLGAAALIVCRVATSISLVVLLTITTPWAKLTAALRAVGVPRLFVQVLSMAYRYLFLLLGSVDDMYTSRKSRMVTDEGPGSGGRAFVAASAGALFGRAHALSDEVHAAMLSRGYTGESRALESWRLSALDFVWLAASVLAVVATIGADRVLFR